MKGGQGTKVGVKTMLYTSLLPNSTPQGRLEQSYVWSEGHRQRLLPWLDPLLQEKQETGGEQTKKEWELIGKST